MIHIVIGTKAQLIKMAPVMVSLQQREIPYNFIFTGQHKNTIDEMLSDFGIKKPDIILYSGKDITSIWAMLLWLSRILLISYLKRSSIFQNDNNGIVLVHGDTLSTLLGALIGKMAKMKVGHIESGLRSFHYFHPFPEEITRILTFSLSNYLFCPGDLAVKNVRNYKKEVINIFENTLYDTIKMSSRSSQRQNHIPDYSYCVVSLHRFENIFIESRFCEIIKIIESIAVYQKILLILHPPTEKQLNKYGLLEKLKLNNNISLRPRYNHSDFLSLLERCEFVMTDGGSLQEETYYMGIPCLLFRKVTERQEGIGRNVVLSNYNVNVIQNFCRTFSQYRYEPIELARSPTNIIVERIILFNSISQ